MATGEQPESSRASRELSTHPSTIHHRLTKKIGQPLIILVSDFQRLLGEHPQIHPRRFTVFRPIQKKPHKNIRFRFHHSPRLHRFTSFSCWSFFLCVTCSSSSRRRLGLFPSRFLFFCRGTISSVFLPWLRNQCFVQFSSSFHLRASQFCQFFLS